MDETVNCQKYHCFIRKYIDFETLVIEKNMAYD